MMRKYSRFAALFFAFLLAFAADAQVHFSVTRHDISPREFDIVFTGRADAGWHVYSTDLPSGGPTSAEFGIDKIVGAELVGPLKAGSGAKKKMDEIFDMEVSYFEGTAVFRQRVRLTGGPYEVKGYLRYGACNDRSCLPPTSVDCRFAGPAPKGEPQPSADKASAAPPAASADANPDAAATPAALPPATADTARTDAPASDTSAASPAAVSDELFPDAASGATDADAPVTGRSLWVIFLLGMAGGLVALFTPCVWPIIPMTVSFFLKRTKDRRRGVRDAMLYGVSIVVIYVGLGLLVTSIWGASGLNDLSTSAGFNLFFFALLVVFAASFLGGFEITLPSSWGSAVDERAERATGLLSIFLMAATLSIVSFSCTGPIIGYLLVEVSVSGSYLSPAVGMAGFALALALPFTLFALFPSWLKSAPRSGGWLNTVKVVLGFLELAFSLKFLSVADLAYGWHLLDRETFLALWIVIFALLGLYLLDFVRLPHDDAEAPRRTGVTRLFLALASLSFALYMVPGLWGAPLKAVSAFSPPLSTQDFRLGEHSVEARYRDFEAAQSEARRTGKPLIVDFTGHGCVNCRKMEQAVWSDPDVARLMTDDYILVSLYVDDKTPLPAPVAAHEPDGTPVTLRTVGDRWSHFQRTRFGAQAQPFYVLLAPDGSRIGRPYTFDERPARFVRWLEQGLAAR